MTMALFFYPWLHTGRVSVCVVLNHVAVWGRAVVDSDSNKEILKYVIWINNSTTLLAKMLLRSSGKVM
jgi:hypothetical protein